MRRHRADVCGSAALEDKRRIPGYQESRTLTSAGFQTALAATAGCRVNFRGIAHNNDTVKIMFQSQLHKTFKLKKERSGAAAVISVILTYWDFSAKARVIDEVIDKSACVRACACWLALAPLLSKFVFLKSADKTARRLPVPASSSLGE